jgi:hypothetical protein
MGGRERAFELDAPRDQRLFGHRLRGVPDRPLLADRGLMNIRGIAAAIAFSICVSACEGPKGEPGAVGPAGEKGEPLGEGQAYLLPPRSITAPPSRARRAFDAARWSTISPL